MTDATLAQRMALTTHQSPLRFKLERLKASGDDAGSLTLEAWLLDVANARGATVIRRPKALPLSTCPTEDDLSNEELVVACCQPNAVDHPQLLRPPAQLISRGQLDMARLILTAKRERTGRILAELARQALRVDPNHDAWKRLLKAFANERPLRDTLIHWTRLAEPVMAFGKANAQSWRLVS